VECCKKILQVSVFKAVTQPFLSNHATFCANKKITQPFAQHYTVNIVECCKKTLQVSVFKAVTQPFLRNHATFCANKKSRNLLRKGKVVGIIRRKWRQYCGMLQENPSG
jgi:hypothetical protein